MTTTQIYTASTAEDVARAYADVILDTITDPSINLGFDDDRSVFGLVVRDIYGRFRIHPFLQETNHPEPTSVAAEAVRRILAEEPLPFGQRSIGTFVATPVWVAGTPGWTGRPSEDPNRTDGIAVWYSGHEGVTLEVRLHKGTRKAELSTVIPTQIRTQLDRAWKTA